MAADQDGRGGWAERLLLDTLKALKEDIEKLRDSQSDSDRIANEALTKVESVERQLERIDAESRASTLDIVAIKATAKGAGQVAGAITGTIVAALVSLLVAWILKTTGVT